MSSTLEDLQGAFLDAPCMAELGDTIFYRAAGQAVFAEILVYADHTDALRSLDGGQIIDQDVTIEALRSSVPRKPTEACRVRLPKVAGKTFKPINVRSNQNGDYWLFELKAVAQ